MELPYKTIMNKTEKLDMYGYIKHLNKEFALSTFTCNVKSLMETYYYFCFSFHYDNLNVTKSMTLCNVMRSMRYVQLSWKDWCFQLILDHYNLEHSIISFLLLDVPVDLSKYFRHSTQSYRGLTQYS